MSRILLVLTVLAAAACVPSVVRTRGAATRELRELGRLSVPARLDAFPAVERADFATFAFDHTALWPMGSERPVNEKLVVGIWTPASRGEARERTLGEAGGRLRDVELRREGALEVGEGVYEVNASEYPAWLVTRDVEEHGLTIAYMVWKKRGSLDRARRVVEEAAHSFAPAATPAAYLAAARERPARERAERLRTLEAQLAARGVRLTVDGGPVERDGTWYELHTDAHRGLLFTTLQPLGALPRAARYRHARPSAPNRVGNWPPVVWYAHDGTGVARDAFDGDPELSPAMDARLAARHAGAPDRAHFYAAGVSLLDASGDSVAPLDWFDDAARRMRALLSAGKLVR